MHTNVGVGNMPCNHEERHARAHNKAILHTSVLLHLQPAFPSPFTR
jgi:hypothetical protein